MKISFEKAGGFAGIFLQGILDDHEIPEDLKQTIRDNFSMIRDETEADNPYLADAESYAVDIEDTECDAHCAFTTSNPASFRNMIARKIVREYVRRELLSREGQEEE